MYYLFDLTHGEILTATNSSRELEASLALNLMETEVELGIYDLDNFEENPNPFQT